MKPIIITKGGCHLWGQCDRHSPGFDVNWPLFVLIWSLFSGLPLPTQASPSSVTRASTSPRLLGWVRGCGLSEIFWTKSDSVLTKVKRHSGMMTRATFLLNKKRMVCYSTVFPRWYLSNLDESIVSRLAGRCVARNPKEMVRQVAAARELDIAQVSEGWSPSISSFRRGLSCLLAGRLGTRCCHPTWRRRGLSLASTTKRWRRRRAASWVSPRSNNN